MTLPATGPSSPHVEGAAPPAGERVLPPDAERPRPPGTEVPPGAPPKPWRPSGRLLVLDPDDRLLLLRARDPWYPEMGEWWEVPGGGLDDGEDVVAAAVREVLEETGVTVPADAVGAATWTLDVTYLWLGARRWSHQVVRLATLAGTPPPPVPPAYTEEEAVTFLVAEWVPVADVPGLPRTFPDGIVGALAALRAGRDVDSGFRVWC